MCFSSFAFFLVLHRKNTNTEFHITPEKKFIFFLKKKEEKKQSTSHFLVFLRYIVFRLLETPMPIFDGIEYMGLGTVQLMGKYAVDLDALLPKLEHGKEIAASWGLYGGSFSLKFGPDRKTIKINGFEITATQIFGEAQGASMDALFDQEHRGKPTKKVHKNPDKVQHHVFTMNGGLYYMKIVSSLPDKDAKTKEQKKEEALDKQPETHPLPQPHFLSNRCEGVAYLLWMHRDYLSTDYCDQIIKRLQAFSDLLDEELTLDQVKTINKLFENVQSRVKKRWDE